VTKYITIVEKNIPNKYCSF